MRREVTRGGKASVNKDVRRGSCFRPNRDTLLLIREVTGLPLRVKAAATSGFSGRYINPVVIQFTAAYRVHRHCTEGMLEGGCEKEGWLSAAVRRKNYISGAPCIMYADATGTYVRLHPRP